MFPLFPGSEKKLEDILNTLAEENPPKQMLAILASILNSGLTCSFKSKEQCERLFIVVPISTSPYLLLLTESEDEI